jgi:predicted peroxiredoxin
MSDFGKKLAILISAAPDERPEAFVMPFVYAAVAAAMEVEVELHFTGRAVRLLVAGVAADLDVGEGDDRRLAAYMREAAQHGARFFACSKALKQHVAAEEPKIAGFAGVAGAATVVMRSLDPEWRVLCF